MCEQQWASLYSRVDFSSRGSKDFMEAIMLLLGYETSWNVILIWYDMTRHDMIWYDFFKVFAKWRGDRSCIWAHRHSAVAGVFVCLCSESLGCFCAGHAPAASLGDVYEKWCACDSCGVTFLCRDTGNTLWRCFCLFTFNSVFMRNSVFLFMLTDKLTWKSKDTAPSFCFMLLTP